MNDLFEIRPKLIKLIAYASVINSGIDRLRPLYLPFQPSTSSIYLKQSPAREKFLFSGQLTSA